MEWARKQSCCEALVAALVEFAASSRHPFARPVGTLSWSPAWHVFHNFRLLSTNDFLSCQIFPVSLCLKNRRNGISRSTLLHLLLCTFLVGFSDSVEANNNCKGESSPQLPSLGTALIENSRCVHLLKNRKSEQQAQTKRDARANCVGFFFWKTGPIRTYDVRIEKLRTPKAYDRDRGT